MDRRSTEENETPNREADQWTRNSLTMRRMTWTNIWTLLGALAVAVVIVTVWMAT